MLEAIFRFPLLHGSFLIIYSVLLLTSKILHVTREPNVEKTSVRRGGGGCISSEISSFGGSAIQGRSAVDPRFPAITPHTAAVGYPHQDAPKVPDGHSFVPLCLAHIIIFICTSSRAVSG